MLASRNELLPAACFSLNPLLLLGIIAEKEHDRFVNGIEGFDRAGLNRTSVDVKNPLPDNKST